LKLDNVTTPPRLPWIDSLRGLAVVLMLQQHLSVWLWGGFGLTYSQVRDFHPDLMAMYVAGHMAAPIFVILAGVGAVFLLERKPTGNAILVKRGTAVIVAGYLLNLAAPRWFDPATWYVLHLIGFCLVLSPLLIKLKPWILALTGFSALAMSAAGQTWLATPLMLGDAHMNNAGLPGGLLRLALFEGHFPVFPWLGVFCAGLWAGRMLGKEKWRAIFVAGAVFALAGVALWLSYGGGRSFMIRGPWYRAFALLPHFYPPLPPFMLILTGTSLLALGAFRWIDGRRPLGEGNPLACLGRTSLSMIVFHIVLFNEVIRLTGVYENLSETWARALLAVFITGLTALAMLWRRIEYRYGLEWLVRKIAG